MTVDERPRSLLQGNDQDCLALLLQLHAQPNARIRDVTYVEGSMWRGTPYEVEGYNGDFLKLPDDWTNSCDVLVFDPPHITEAGKKSRYYTRFGAGHPALAHKADISHLFEPFLEQASRVLRKKGIVICKLIDVVHRGHYRHQYVDWINAVRAQRGFVACDLLIKEEHRAETLKGPNWDRVKHTRRAHVYWSVARKGRC